MVLLEVLAIGLAFFVAYGVPVLAGAWLGSRVKYPPLAFLLGWIATPFAGFLLGLVLELSGPRHDGGGLMIIVLPVCGVLTGVISGIIAAVVASQRQAKRSTIGASAEPLSPGPRSSLDSRET